MCTAMTFNADSLYFGRTLDYDFPFDNQIIVLPRNYSLNFTNGLSVKNHSAIIGNGVIIDGYPLLFEGANESGLCVAALNFSGNTIYDKPQENKENIASFEFISYILSTCISVSGAHTKLLGANITDNAFCEKLPPSPLHFIIADKKDCITVESTKDGLKIYENPVGVLTNDPTFDIQLFLLNNYSSLSVYNPQNKVFGSFEAKSFSRGMGALGLPGDYSSNSRFIRTVFIKNHLSLKEDNVGQFFHALDSVSIPSGTVITENGKEQETQYACCIDSSRGIYYYVTKENRQISAVTLQNENLDGENIVTFPLIKKQEINRQN